MFDMDLNFTQMKTSRAYKALCDFKEDYYGIEGRESFNQVTSVDFVDFFPILVLDGCRQPERLKTFGYKPNSTLQSQRTQPHMLCLFRIVC